jgi:urease accessory protein
MTGSATRFALPALAGLAIPVQAFAHTGHGHDGLPAFVAGLLHPLTGLDHLAAMMMVGCWAGYILERRAWALPVSFMTCMLAGYGFAVAGFAFPFVEGLIATSLLALGLCLALAVRVQIVVALAVTGLFAFAHGHAHGAELPPAAGAGPFAAGFALSGMALLFGGFGFARWGKRPALGRLIGAAGALGGALLLTGS